MRSGARVHDRMPALLAEQDFEPCAERHRWRRTVEVGPPKTWCKRWPVSKRVNSSKAPLIEKLEATAPPTAMH